MVLKFTTKEKVEIVLIVGDHYNTYREAAKIFNARYPNKIISHVTVGDIFNKFKSTGTVSNKFSNKHQVWRTDEDTQLEVLQAVVENPKISLRNISQTVPRPVTKSTAQVILRKNNFYPYKPKFLHKLQPRDFDSRFLFCSWFQGEVEDDPFFARKILFSDEAMFTSNGVVCSQNCRWWSDENPHFVIECRDQYSFKTNVWCGVFKNQIVGPYFFRENITSEIYLNFLDTELFDFFHGLPLDLRNTLWFQHDGAPCHSSARVTEFLNRTFPQRWIGRRSEFAWPPRSPDLTPLDFFYGDS